MNINPINFGKKIPIAKCHIKDVEKGKFVPATFYEIDCTDINDNNEIYDLNNNYESIKTNLNIFLSFRCI